MSRLDELDRAVQDLTDRLWRLNQVRDRLYYELARVRRERDALLFSSPPSPIREEGPET